MPINYGSQINEHNIVREDCGIFDVSHMTILDFQGLDVETFVRKLISNDVRKLSEPYEGLYSAMVNESGVTNTSLKKKLNKPSIRDPFME